MPQPVPYNDFLANVNVEDLNMLMAFVTNQRIEAGSVEEADTLFTEATRLYAAGMVSEVHRIYKERDGVLVQFLDGYITDAGRAYLTRLAYERPQVSREPLPTP